MRISSFSIFIVLVATNMLVWVPSSTAFVYTNDNFDYVSHEQPEHFERLADGSFWGYTETGREFRQVPVPNQYDVRIQKFIIDEVFFYITDQGAIYADTDLQALSIHFSRA